MIPPPPALLNTAMLRWLDEVSGQGIFATDRDLVIRSWNNWLERQTGLSSASTIGEPLLRVYPDLVTRGIDVRYRSALDGEVSILAHRLHGHVLPIPAGRPGAASEPMPQSGRIAPLLHEGAVIGTITVIDDVSERVNSEFELRRQIAASDEARAQAEEASRVKDEFLATLSHEIRTPLNAVLGWTKILRGRNVDAPMLDHALEVIERNATAQALLIEDMLDMARVVTGKLRLEMQAVDPIAATLAAIDVVGPAAAAKGVMLRTHLDSGVASIQGDPNRVQQIIWNILSNAVKFTPTGGTVSVRLEQSAHVVVFAVQDSGEGIAAEFLPFVFDRFRQAKASASRTHGGLGLGLALVRQLVEMQGGSVTVASAGPGLGATFTVRFPAQAAAGSRTAGTAEPRAVDQERLREVRILVVDDEQDARELAVAALEQSGAHVSAVASADQAVALLEAGEDDRPLQLLIADIGMPGQDGYALISRIRNMPGESRRIRALAVTAYAGDDDRRRALAAGFDMHLPKPVTPDDLVSAAATLLHSTAH